MVYNGPSGGCKACRTRRVKCDQTKPACNNCTRRKQICPGYADVFDGAHRSQNNVVIRRVAKQKGSGKDGKDDKGKAREESPTEESSLELASAASTSTVATTNRGPLQWIIYSSGATPAASPSPSSSHESDSSDESAIPFITDIGADGVPSIIPGALKQDPQAASVGFFFRHYSGSLVDPQTFNSFHQVWQPMYLASSENSPLRTATAAVTVNIAMMWCFKGCDTHLPRSLFTEAIAATRKAMLHPTESTTDELLMTILIFDLYDALVLHYTPGVPNYGKHKEGALALIKHRGVANHITQRSRGMLDAVRHSILHFLLSSRRPFPENTEEIFKQNSNPPSLGISLDLISMPLVKLQADLWSLRRESSPSTNAPERRKHYEDIIAEATRIETMLMNWKASTTTPLWQPYFIPRESVVAPILSAGFYGPHCVIFQDLTLGDMWTTHALRCIYNLQIIRQSLADEPSLLVEPKYQALLRQADVQIQEFTDFVCFTVPFHIGDTVVPTNPIYNASINFPYTFIHDPATGLNQRIPRPQTNYQARAAASGGWIIYSQLVAIYRFAEPEDDAMPISLREGQLDWIKSQVKRLQTIFLFVDPPYFKRLSPVQGSSSGGSSSSCA